MKVRLINCSHIPHFCVTNNYKEFGLELYNPSHCEVIEEGEVPEATESLACHTSKEAEKYA